MSDDRKLPDPKPDHEGVTLGFAIPETLTTNPVIVPAVVLREQLPEASLDSVLPGSSTAEQGAVNSKAEGSIPSRAVGHQPEPPFPEPPFCPECGVGNGSHARLCSRADENPLIELAKDDPLRSQGITHIRQLPMREVSTAAPFSGTWQILVVRHKLTPSAHVSQFIHACRDSAIQWALAAAFDLDGGQDKAAIGMMPSLRDTVKFIVEEVINGMPPEDTRNVILSATKAQLAKLIEDLTAAGIPFRQNKEISGDLRGVITSVGLVTTDKAKVDPFIAHLRKAKFVKMVDEEDAGE